MTHQAGGLCHAIFMPRASKLEPFILQAALQALEHQQEQVDQQIAEVQALLGRRRAGAAASAVRPGKRMMSLAARRRRLDAAAMRFEHLSFGSIRIDGVTYEYDLVIDRGIEAWQQNPENPNAILHVRC